MRLLRNVFGVGESHRMFQADVLRWKCFAPHPFWEGSRGYALRYKGEMAAFVCLVPIRFLTVSGTVPGCNFIDWAASKAVPGAGIMLRRHIQGLIGTMINTGGTEDARQVLPKIGYQVRAERHAYTRVVRPWRHFQAHQKDWKSPVRLARDYRELRRAAPVGRSRSECAARGELRWRSGGGVSRSVGYGPGGLRAHSPSRSAIFWLVPRPKWKRTCCNATTRRLVISY
jgi:hypothetical protein